MINTDKDNDEDLKEYDISIHIFSVSATMVGVCLTVIGILGVTTNIKTYSTYADDILSINALGYLVSCFMSYIAIRSRKRKNKYYFERIADTVFLFSLLVTGFVCIFIVIEFSPGFFVR